MPLSIPQPPPGPARALVAETHSVNRKVMVQLLENLGCQVDAVSSGTEAIQAARRNRYSFILLDCESGEPNGYDAARSIREEEDPGARTPIIALTGGGFESDRKRREGAGIDDYIAKPIDIHTARSILYRWAPGIEQRAPERPTSLESGALDSLRNLAGPDHPALFAELIELFLGSTPPLLAEMRRSILAGDSKALAAAAHSLKSASGQMGATRMREICTALEALGRTGSVQGAAILAGELTLAFERASQDLRALSRKPRPESSESSPAVRHPGVETGLRFDLEAAAPVFRGKRLLVLHEDSAVMEAIGEALSATDSEVVAVASPVDFSTGWAKEASLLFLGIRGGQSKALDLWRRLRQEGVRTPVIVLARSPSPVLLQYIEELGGECILEPVRAEDVVFQAYRRLLAARHAPSGATHSLDVLVAEDDLLTSRFLMTSLASNGFRVTHAPDGSEALELLRKKTFGLVLLDAEMPTVDGYEVLSNMRLDPRHRGTPVLMLSARAQEHEVVRAFDLGADDYISKPFNPLELVARVRRLARPPA